MLKVHLGTNSVVEVIGFDSPLAPQRSFLTEAQVDTKDRTAYVADTGTGAILVVNLMTGKIRRLLFDDPTAKSETIKMTVQYRDIRYSDGSLPQLHCHGLALDAQGEYLYYHALTGRTLYRIATTFLKDERVKGSELSREVEDLGRVGACDGMVMDAAGNLYLASIEENAIRVRRPNGVIETILQDGILNWPDNLILGPDGSLYLNTSQLQLLPRYNQGRKITPAPYWIWKLQPLTGTVAADR